MEFVLIKTLPLELRAGISIKTGINTDPEDGAYAHAIIYNNHNSADLVTWRMHNPNQLFIMYFLKLSKVLVDNITQFLLRLP